MTTALIQATFPAGYPAALRRDLISVIKQAFSQAMGYAPEQVSVYLYEHRREDVCQNAWEKMSLNVYYQKGHSEVQKHRFALAFDKLCADLFGEQKQDTYIIFKEHHTDNACENGILCIYSPEYVEKYGL